MVMASPVQKNYQNIGLLSGLISFLSFVIFIPLAYIYTPSYDPINQTISKLGIITPNGSFYFSIGNLISGLSIIIYYWFFLNRVVPLSPRTINNTSITTISSIFGVLGGIFLIGVGILPDRDLTIIPHFLTATAMFCSIGGSIFLFSIVLLEDEAITITGRLIAFLGILTCVIAILHGVFSVLKIFGPLWQKTSVAAYIVWQILFFIFIFVNYGKKQLP